MTHDNAAHSYRVEAVRSGDWWSITVPELSGVFSQAKRLDQVERSAREAIAMMLDIDEAKVGSLEVDVTHRPLSSSSSSASTTLWQQRTKRPMQQQPRGVKWHSCSARKASPFATPASSSACPTSASARSSGDDDPTESGHCNNAWYIVTRSWPHQ